MATIALVATLGLVALQVHAALPDHHHQGGKITACIASLATMAVIVAMQKRRKSYLPAWEGTLSVLLPAWRPLDLGGDERRTRAGPLEEAVLRL
jgi:hypothetical protein